jgi:hypothetical protein
MFTKSLLRDVRPTSVPYVHANHKVTGKSTQSHDYAEDFEFVAQFDHNTVILRSSKESIAAANIRKTLCESDSHIMKLVNGDTIENVECVSIWEQHNK